MPAPLPIVIASAGPVLLAGLRAILEARPGLSVLAACSTLEGALRELRRHKPRVLLTEGSLCDPDNHETLTLLRRASAETRIAVISLHTIPLIGEAGHLPPEISAVLPIDVSEDALIACVHALGNGGCWPPRADCPGEQDTGARPGRRSPLALLSVRERQIAQLVAFGKKNREIAETCGITPGTVKLHLHRIYRKLAVNNRLALFRKLVQEAQR